MTASCGYYILHRSLYYKRLAARKGGATLDAPKYNARRARISKTMPCRQYPRRQFTHAIVRRLSFHACQRNFTHAYRYWTIFQRRINHLRSTGGGRREGGEGRGEGVMFEEPPAGHGFATRERIWKTNITSNHSTERETPKSLVLFLNP